MFVSLVKVDILRLFQWQMSLSERFSQIKFFARQKTTTWQTLMQLLFNRRKKKNTHKCFRLETWSRVQTNKQAGRLSSLTRSVVFCVYPSCKNVFHLSRTWSIFSGLLVEQVSIEKDWHRAASCVVCSCMSEHTINHKNRTVKVSQKLMWLSTCNYTL